MLGLIGSVVFLSFGFMLKGFAVGAIGDIKYMYNILQVISYIVSGISLLMFIVSLFDCTSTIVGLRTKIQEATRNIKIAMHRFDEITKTVASYVDQYPKEADMLKDFKFELLLLVPEIKSNNLLMEQIKLALKHQNQIYALMEKINSDKQSLDYYKDLGWLFVLSFRSPIYTDSNPLDAFKGQDSAAEITPTPVGT